MQTGREKARARTGYEDVWMRLIEMGREPLVKVVYPDQTTFISTDPDPLDEEDDGTFSFTTARLPKIISLVRDPNIDGIFLSRGTERASEGFGALARLVANRRVVKRGVPLARVFGDRVLRWSADVPFVLHDPSDSTFITRPLLPMWERADIVYKREIPLDRWQIFMRSIHNDMPTARFRKKERYRRLIDKMHPISLGLRPWNEKLLPEPMEKTTDVFFAGMGANNSSIRDTGQKELEALREQGLDIVSPSGRLPLEDFYKQCAQARLVWSPHGFGHDCFRHYEVAGVGSVPLINRAPVEQYAPFRHGETGVIYDPERGGLTAAIREALIQRDKLTDMGLAARAHFRAHHSAKARVDHMLGGVGITVG
ncbi:glycosyltransferase [Tepidamorphus sp. 3E244]|uniref:glycosyltransferase n=1 Tax=Tepidamorphus sp. 3E244 TaxID=3385498 RepID=UPI0038FCA39C